MATNKKIEEKYQRLLKEVQKRPENRKCFDCTGRANQYVVLEFNTFVCTTCSGIHRELQHRRGPGVVRADPEHVAGRGGERVRLLGC